ncbi:hypothetical protein [Chitinophaga rhizophila]|uniref:Uncharacterized protein n=1 Tax=Chitinophaga rhizophila TaxID=2866212 RepID=A0ABS7GA63_9BACT|nr:hypothetical protein [Chitinophaga rhizophila]MBW8683428.1 hypothetical protein [Chitinophaga rhizophila]
MFLMLLVIISRAPVSSNHGNFLDPISLHIAANNKIVKMVKKEEQIVMRAVAICFKPYLKSEEALIYCNLGRTQFAQKCKEFGIFKNTAGYYEREQLDNFMGGEELAIKKQVDSKNLDRRIKRLP